MKKHILFLLVPLLFIGQPAQAGVLAQRAAEIAQAVQAALQRAAELVRAAQAAAAQRAAEIAQAAAAQRAAEIARAAEVAAALRAAEIVRAAEAAAAQRAAAIAQAAQAALLQAQAEALNPTVATVAGKVRGKLVGRSHVFLGIPYALPPVGNLRWRRPQPLLASNATISALQAGSSCVQTKYDFATGTPEGEPFGQEDCLYLNVWAPKPVGFQKKAVMVFIHGGGFTSGSGLSMTGEGFELYNGQDLAELGDVIVVTLNYRLGALGFLAHPALSEEEGGASGNYGLLDQIEALKWVKQNISGFGGDPRQVTIFGESAGGMSICSLLASPLASGLFRSAILQSAYCPSGSMPVLEARGLEMGRALGCNEGDARCLRLKSANQWVAGRGQYAPSSPFFNELYFAPAVDGYLLSDRPLRTLLSGRGNPVAVIAGHNSGEFPVTSLSPEVKAWSDADFLRALQQEHGATLGQQLFLAYHPSKYPTVSEAVADFKTDVQFSCPQRQFLRTIASRGWPGFSYVYNQPPFSMLQNLVRLKDPTKIPLKPFHGTELISVFQKVDEIYASILPLPTLHLSDRKVEREMGAYWTSFAKATNPNNVLFNNWPAYDRTSEPYLEIAAQSQGKQPYFRSKCDLYDLTRYPQ